MSTISPEERSVEVDDVPIPYFVAGPQSSGKPPVMLVHGTGGSTWGHFRYLFTMLSQQRRVISIDLRSPRGIGVNGLKVEHFERQVVAVIETESPDRPVDLLGYSLGAVIAAAVAGRYPEIVASLVLADGWMKTDSQQQLRNRIWRALRNEDSASIKAYMTFCAVSGSHLALVPLGNIETQVNAIRLDAFLDQMMDLNSRVDITELVTAITAPTLVIAGTEDQMVPKRHSKALFGAVANAVYREIHSGHALFIERPAEVLHAVTQFLAAPFAYPSGTVVPADHP